MARVTTKDLAELLEQIQAQLTALSERVERLESATQPEQPVASTESTPVQPAAKEPAPLPEAAKPEFTEEELIAISAAVAAFLGERVRIKQIRLLSSHTWAQQGRVWIQASHNLHN